MISEKLIPRKYQQEHTSLCWTIVKGNYFAHVPAYVHSCMFMSFSLSLSLSLGRGSSLSDYVLYVCVYVSCVNVNLCVCVRAYVLYVYVCKCVCSVFVYVCICECVYVCMIMCDNLLCLESRLSCIDTANHTTSHTFLSSYLPASDMRFTIQGGKGDGGTSQKSVRLAFLKWSMSRHDFGPQLTTQLVAV